MAADRRDRFAPSFSSVVNSEEATYAYTGRYTRTSPKWRFHQQSVPVCGSAAGAGRDMDVIITVAPGSLLSKAQSGIPCGFKMSFN